MILYVVRHGVAEPATPDGGDRARRLTPRGHEKMQAVAQGLAALGVDLDVLLTSPLPRAAETAAIVCEALGGRPAPRVFAALEPGAGAAQTLHALRPFSGRGGVAIVGHEPGLSEVVSLLLTGSPAGLVLALKKGSVVALEVEDLGSRAGATLRWMLTPRQLRRLGR